MCTFSATFPKHMSLTSETDIADILCEFLEISIHNILYHRKLYPDAIFERRRKYGVIVYQSIYPGLNEYIANCMKTVHFHVKKKSLKFLYICISSLGALKEKYVFDIVELSTDAKSDLFLIQLEQNLRDFCLKLHSSISYLPDLPPESTFSIQTSASEQAIVEFNGLSMYEEFPWVQLGNKKHSECQDIIPICSTNLKYLYTQLYIESFNK